MKGNVRYILAAAVLAVLLCACGGGVRANVPVSDNEAVVEPSASDVDTAWEQDVDREDCNAVYGQIIGVNGDHLTVRAEDTVLALTVDTKLLIDWKAEEDVILYYTGKFGDTMQVHYMERWTENSEVTKPKKKESGSEDGGAVVG